MKGEFGDQLVVVEYHPSLSSDPMYLPWSAQRMSFYEATGYPTVIFDGITRHVGTYGTPVACANAYRTTINTRLAVPASVSIDGAYTYSPEVVSLSATFKLEDAVTLASPMAVFAVLENDIHSGGRVYEHVVRAGEGQFVEGLISVGDEVTVTVDLPIQPTWDMENIECAAWIQKSGGNLLVYQSAALPLVVDFAFDFVDEMIVLPDGNGEALFEGTLLNTTTELETLTVSLDNTFGWPAEFKIEGEAAFHTDPSEVHLDPSASLQVEMKVTTDGTVRIGEGSLEIQSSARVAAKDVRVFNGGPAILFVDDDGTYPHQEEDLLLSALDAKNVLYDHWDVRKGYGGRVPTLPELQEYDAVLWHPGRQNGMVIVDEVQLLTDYLDAGGGLVFSYQQFLAYADTSSNPIDSLFVADYLSVGSYVQDVGADSLIGVAEDPISDGMRFAFDYNSEVHNKADALTPSENGTLCLHSSLGDGYAVRSDLGAARAVFFACYLNAVPDTGADPENLSTLLDRAIEWVLDRNSAAIDEHAVTTLSGIRSIAPNPIRIGSGPAGMAAIQLRVAESAAGRPARLDIFDLNGRLVRNLIDQALPAGTTSAAWDGRSTAGERVGSGIYYLRFTNAAGVDRAPIVVLR
ncbi:MAG: FlgD immunoglobulin-like domain containing protein [Candidatus Eisenbacteria bacterium]